VRTVNSYIGAPLKRFEDFRFLTGRGQYVGDLKRERLLHAVILRSPVAHGTIAGIDAARARAMPGVQAVITAADIGPTCRAFRCGRSRCPSSRFASSR